MGSNQSCRHDFYQTATTVIASLYLKKIVKEKSKVEFTSNDSVSFDLITSDNKRYEKVYNLYGSIVPGETAVLLGGVLAAQHHVALLPLLAVVVLAAVMGDVTGFLSGRRLGSRLRQGRLGRRIGEARWDRVASLLERRGPWAIVLGRWVGLLRALTPTMAGASGLPMRRFLPASMVGPTRWPRNSKVVTTPKSPPPPRSAQ